MKTRQSHIAETICPMPAGHDTRHGACGKTWKQRGNITGHCAACHETYESSSLFDAHRYTTETGNRACRLPQDLTIGGRPLELHNGAWRVFYTEEEKAANRARFTEARS